jgi:phosphatidylglycerophosphate synthase
VRTAILVEHGPDLAWEDTTVAGRLEEQLRSLGIETVRRVPAAGALEAVAAAARGADGDVVVARADVVTQREALAGALADPRVPTAVLSARADPGAGARPLRSERGRVLAAGSDFHTVGAPTEWFLGVLKVAREDAGRLAEAADELSRARLGDDLVALLLVALVRRGARVGQSDLRALFWARPASPEEVARGVRAISGHDEEQVLLDSSVKPIDGFFTTFFVSPYSKYLARWAARRGFTPNQVTSVSMALGVLAAAAFATGDRWGLVTGAVLLQIAFTTDCVDGQLARFTRTFTPLGAWLDSTFDRLKEYVVYAGLAIGAAQAGDPVWVLAGAALTLQTARHGFDFAFAATEHQTMTQTTQRPLTDPSDGTPSDPEHRVDTSPRIARSTVHSTSSAGGSGVAGVLRSWRRIDRVPGLIWVKRIVVLPIGERFALISLTAALFTPQTTFVVLLVWGGLAAVYGLAGRVLRALLP